MIPLFPFWRIRLGNAEAAPPPSVVLLGGGPGKKHHSYLTPYSKYREEEYKRSIAEKRTSLAEINKEIADAEALKQDELRAARLALNAAEEAALEAQLQEEINVLRMERVRLMRLIDDEETILVLLLCLPLH